MAEQVVVVRGLTKQYGEKKALDNVSFEVNRGEVFALLGPNGAGKTTTVEILEGVRQPTAGSVSVLGADLEDNHASRIAKRKVGILPQDFNAFARLTVQENLEFLAGLYGNPVSVAGIMDLMGVAGERGTRFSRLSGGIRKRVGLASALVNDPDLLFLDEPTTGLDPEGRHSTWKVLRELSSKQRTIILTTHHMEEAQQLADRIGILVEGKMAILDTPAGLLNRYGGGKALVIKGGGDAAFGTLRRFFDTVSMDGSDVVLPFDRLRDLQVALTALVDRGLEAEVSLRTPSIEEVFLKLAGFKMSDSGDPS